MSTPLAGSSRIESKWIDVGLNGCCAIVGYLGSHVNGLSLTRILRNAAGGQSSNAIDQMDVFLTIAAKVWEQHCYIKGGQLPNNRREGHLILHMYCADLVGGNPMLRIACLVVGADRKPRLIDRRFDDLYGTLLRVDGAIDTKELEAGVLGSRVYPYNSQQEIERKEFDLHYRDGLPWARALQSWHKTVLQARLRGEPVVSTDGCWTQDNAFSIARFLFPHFSANTADVGPPFEVREVSTLGRRSCFL